MPQIWKLLKYFGHGNLPQSNLAGLLSECGYKGDQLRAILNKAKEPRDDPHGLKRHKSIIVRNTAIALERSPTLRRMAPESTGGVCAACTCGCCVIGCLIASLSECAPSKLYPLCWATPLQVECTQDCYTSVVHGSVAEVR